MRRRKPKLFSLGETKLRRSGEEPGTIQDQEDDASEAGLQGRCGANQMLERFDMK